MRERRFLVLGMMFIFLQIPAAVYSQDIEWKLVSGNAPWCPRDSGGEVVFKNTIWILGRVIG
ncbi:MAG: hypothetical protein Q8O92_05790 [Candidatus Latescibacter sp.]|nr:hypothetical protein [Candidatus Latescibacter sp.]